MLPPAVLHGRRESLGKAGSSHKLIHQRPANGADRWGLKNRSRSRIGCANRTNPIDYDDKHKKQVLYVV